MTHLDFYPNCEISKGLVNKIFHLKKGHELLIKKQQKKTENDTLLQGG